MLIVKFLFMVQDIHYGNKCNSSALPIHNEIDYYKNLDHLSQYK